jgi:putative ABC transport system permease protein
VGRERAARPAARRTRAPGVRSSRGAVAWVALALASGIGLGAALLGVVRGAARADAPYADPLLRGAGAEWLPPSTPERQSIPEVQGMALDLFLAILLALTILTLAITLVSLLVLVLARAAGRRPEVALRAALGARQGRLVAQLLGEARLPLLLGAAAGLTLGMGGAFLLHATWPYGPPPWGHPQLGGWSAAAWGAAIAAATLLAWISPARVAGRRDLRRYLSTGGRATAGRGEALMRQTLAVAQIAACLVLLTGAALLLRAFAGPPEEGRGPGFDASDTLTVRITLPVAQGEVLPRMARELSELPGVRDVSLASPGAWVGLAPTERVTAVCGECSVGVMLSPVNRGPARIHTVSPGFFAALGAPLLRGRELADTDAAGEPRVAVISTAFANRLFPGGEPLGKGVQLGGRQGDWYTVVGVVGDLAAEGIGTGAEPVAALYLSALQHPAAALDVAVRTEGEPLALLPAVEAVVGALWPGATISQAMTMEEYLARFRAPLRWFAFLFAAVTGIALLFAATGLRNVMAHLVARRTREIGVRMALGARVRDVMRLILRQGGRLAVIGTVLGLIGAVPLARLLQIYVSGVVPFDGGAFSLIAALLAVVALGASLGPALRAARVDPQVALGAE